MFSEREKRLLQRQPDRATRRSVRDMVESHFTQCKIDALDNSMGRVCEGVVKIKDDCFRFHIYF
jgi:hypothetical protein